MVYLFIYTILIVFGRYVFACAHYDDLACRDVDPLKGDYFSNRWPVHVDGNEDDAKKIAEETGFQYVEPIEGFDRHYLFTHPEVAEKHKMVHEDLLEKLKAHDKVLAVGQQYVWQPTINDMHDFKDMVGHSKPLQIETSNFDPDEINFEEPTIPEFTLDKNESIKTTYAENEDLAMRTLPPLPPLEDVVDFASQYRDKQEYKTKRDEAN